jgi:hypothetical protein
MVIEIKAKRVLMMREKNPIGISGRIRSAPVPAKSLPSPEKSSSSISKSTIEKIASNE